MKRPRKMLLSVTATSMAAVVGACSGSPGEPIGKIGRPEVETPADAGTPDVGASASAATSAATDAPPVVDAGPVGPVGKVAADRDAGLAPNAHPDRVGTTATVEDHTPLAPTVGTTAHVPDKKK